MIFFDTETCGLHGMAVLIQWAENNGAIKLHSVWNEPIYKTLDLIRRITTDPDGVVGFNLAFDWFHLCKLYTVFSLVNDPRTLPISIIDEIGGLEPNGCDGPCLKPISACDLMLHARKGPYQSTMDRSDVRVKRVPTQLAWHLAQELENRIKLSPIYFARRKEERRQWQVYDIEDEDGEIDPAFKDIVLKFAPSSALKALAVDALKIDPTKVLRFGDVDLDEHLFPEEVGYAPYARAIGSPGNWKRAWPDYIRFHISHWSYNEKARQYATDDVHYTRELYKHFGRPPLGDDDSILACMVAAVRWKGFRLDLEGIKALREDAKSKRFKNVNGANFEIPTSAAAVRTYVNEFLSDSEKLAAFDAKATRTVEDFETSTKKVLLQEIAKFLIDCPKCNGSGSIAINQAIEHEKCQDCVNGAIDHPAAIRAQEVLDARMSNYEADFYEKLLLAGRLHASFKVIGTLSSRMAGADGLNPQGIKKEKKVRKQFPLAFTGYTLCGGDFDGFEVTLADACYSDPDLRKDLQSGKKIHALFGVHVYPDMTYEEILATSGTKDDRYTRCKSAVFAMFYGGEGFTLKERLGVDIDTANKAYDAFCKRYRRVGTERKKVFDQFCSMRQPGGIGTKVEWNEPADYIESLFGFRRYFTLENRICRTLFQLAEDPPDHWLKQNVKVIRRDRVQTASGAVRSALFGAAFATQSSNMRSAANHVIQSAGATLTKNLQRKIWDYQPAGIHEFLVIPLNIHDEVLCPVKIGHEENVKKIVVEVVESYRPKVPLIGMEWKLGMQSWAEK